MKDSYFILEFAHSVHGRFKAIRLTSRLLRYLASFLLVLTLVAGGLVANYVRMSWRVSHYEHLQAEYDRLRTQYHRLQTVSTERREQVASLENLANEVSAAYGLSKPPAIDAALDSDNLNVKESIEEFNFLKAASYSDIYHRYAYQWQKHSVPAFWPVNGVLRSSFGGRTDPFSGEGAFHTGIDLQAATGTPVHVTADGVVANAGWSGRYGKLVIIDHGNGIQTYYAHLSQFMVVPGEEVRQGQVIALSGGTGRATSPHLHYEVRLSGSPVNPYKYLPGTRVAKASQPVRSDLGL